VVGTLASRDDAVMATHAIAGDVHVTEVRRHPGIAGMTIFTGFLAGNMISILAGGHHTIMATGATAQYLEVIHPDSRRPHGHAVARLASIGGSQDVPVALSGSLHAVVATLAVARDAHVIKIRRDPGIGSMAIVTVLLAGDVIGVLAGGLHSVMTGGAGTEHLEVINAGGRHPQGCAMATLANLGRLDMGGILAGGGHAIVTANTISADAGMIKSRRTPGDRTVADFARLRCHQMGDRLARGGHAVMTIQTGSLNLQVIHPDNRSPEIAAMAILADVAGLDVVDRGSSSDDVAALLVTGCAFPGGALETSAHMTGFTVSSQMSANQFKTGGQVIEGRTDR